MIFSQRKEGTGFQSTCTSTETSISTYYFDLYTNDYLSSSSYFCLTQNTHRAKLNYGAGSADS